VLLPKSPQTTGSTRRSTPKHHAIFYEKDENSAGQLLKPSAGMRALSSLGTPFGRGMAARKTGRHLCIASEGIRCFATKSLCDSRPALIDDGSLTGSTRDFSTVRSRVAIAGGGLFCLRPPAHGLLHSPQATLDS